MSHPELLEQPPEAVCFDQGLEYHEPKPQGRKASAGRADAADSGR